MLKKDVTYTNFDGNSVEGTAYFNMSRTEAMRYDTEWPGGLKAYVDSFDPTNNPKQIREFFERLVLDAYGEKTPDGEHFVKTEEGRFLFSQSALYDEIVMQLLQNENAAIEFFEATIGVSIRESLNES